MIRSLFAAVVLACAFALPAAAQAPKLPPNVDPQNTIIMETTKGPVIFVLRPDIAPKHAERIKTLAREGFYNNVPFHRVIEGFMAQTGDGQYGNGTGGSRYPDLPAEFSKVPYTRGTVGMARASSPNSANSQFFITFGDASFLNGQYTVIGQVVSGMENVDKLKRGEPVQNPDKIISMKVAADK
ncbi:peptidylprolyl isomerase [Ancylobacter pratisalsi]|uniref:Peptidyl-prolyl cis-trans isomerase n=1 Tax=Ancylobacter pratisalsi TaxID=1745854 RepID=A0A6P1YQW5_9HYPH|nr:peptidylprolyl isomerase [Ancylobacter pratisalsi]QIB35858.1 peptidylprolyl isomerase [Ancylobacter pratisalsi]